MARWRGTSAECAPDAVGYGMRCLPRLPPLRWQNAIPCLRQTLSDIALCAALAERGVRVRSLRDYYAVPPAADTHTLVISYAGLSADCVQELVRRLDTV